MSMFVVYFIRTAQLADDPYRGVCTLQFQEELENTNGATTIRISKKNRQHSGQKKK